MKRSPQQLGRLLSPAPGDPLHQLLANARTLARLTALVRSRLDGGIAEHIHVAGIKGDALVVQSDSAAWLTRLRYRAPELVSVLQHQGYPIQRLHCEVRPAREPVPLPARHAHLSTRAAHLIGEAAEAMPDPALRRALLRLARHGVDNAGTEAESDSDEKEGG